MQPDEINSEIQKIDRIHLAIRYGPAATLLIPPIIAGKGLVPVMFLAIPAWILTKLATAWFANPIRFRMLGRLRDRMSHHLEQLVPGNWRSWCFPRPGVVTVGYNDCLAIFSEGTGYRPVIVEAHQLRSVKVQREQETVAHTRTSGSTGVVIPVGGVGIGFSGGSRSQTTYRTIERQWVEIMWQTERHTAPRVCTVPFDERVEAEKFVVMVRQLQALPPPVQTAPAELVHPE